MNNILLWLVCDIFLRFEGSMHSLILWLVIGEIKHSVNTRNSLCDLSIKRKNKLKIQTFSKVLLACSYAGWNSKHLFMGGAFNLDQLHL